MKGCMCDGRAAAGPCIVDRGNLVDIMTFPPRIPMGRVDRESGGSRSAREFPLLMV